MLLCEPEKEEYQRPTHGGVLRIVLKSYHLCPELDHTLAPPGFPFVLPGIISMRDHATSPHLASLNCQVKHIQLVTLEFVFLAQLLGTDISYLATPTQCSY